MTPPRWALDRAAEIRGGIPHLHHVDADPMGGWENLEAAVAQALAEVAEECVRIVSDGCIARTKFGSTTCRCQWCIQCEVMGNRILAEFEKMSEPIGMKISLSGVLTRSAEKLRKSRDHKDQAFMLKELLRHLEMVRADHSLIGTFFDLWV